MIRILIIIVFFFPSVLFSLPKVSNGKNDLTIRKIIIPESPAPLEIKAAYELRVYFYKITHLLYPVEHEGTIDSSNCIYVGNSGLAEKLNLTDSVKQLKADGFIIRTINNSLVILGENDLGTLYGAYELLEHLGVRWFMPGDIGEVIPTYSNIEISASLNLTEEPAFKIRDIGNRGDWSLRNKMNVNISGIDTNGVTIWGGFSTFGTLLPPSKYFDSHPDWYPLINGVRRKYNPAYGPIEGQTDGNQISLVNAWPEIAQLMNNILSSNPSIDIITLAPNDGGGFSEEPAEVAWDDTGKISWDQRYSRRLLVFYDKVAEQIKLSHPDKIIRVGAYWRYTRPPKDPTILPLNNMQIFLTHYGYSESQPLNEASGPNKDFVDILNGWKERLGNRNAIEIYEYYDKGTWYDLPWPLYRKISVDIPIYDSLGVIGFYTQYSETNSWTLLLNYYIAAKYLWNTKLNIDSLLNDFYNKFYGTASNPMKEYYETLYNAFYSTNKDFDGDANNAVALYTPSVISQCRTYLNEAKNLAGQNSLILERISLADASLTYTSKVVNFLKLKQEAENYSGNSFSEKKSIFDDANSAGQDLKNYMLSNKTFLESGVVNVSGVLNSGQYFLGGDITKVQDEWEKIKNSSQSWHLQLKIPGSLYSVDFIDPMHGWIVGSHGIILYTSDSGRTWVSQNAKTINTLWNVYFINDDIGFAVGDGGIVLSTIDAGDNWNSQIVRTGTWRGVTFIDTSNGWISGYNSSDGGVVYHTTDGGKTWNPEKTKYKDDVYHSIDFKDKYNGYIVGEGGTIFVTTDGGLNWLDKTDSTLTQVRLYKIDILNKNNLIAVGGGGTIIKSTDGGNSWKSLPNNISSTFLSVSFINNDTGWVSCSNGEIYSTTNSGISWNYQASDSSINDNLRGIYFVDDSTGWAVGENGSILKYTGNLNISDVNLSTSSKRFILYQNYPNPFNPTTNIKYSLPKSEHVRIIIFNIQGKVIRRLLDQFESPGNYTITWNGKDDNNNTAPSGIYFCNFQTSEYQQTLKLVLLH